MQLMTAGHTPELGRSSTTLQQDFSCKDIGI